MERKHAPMEEDDGRTIADMSGIERPSLRLPRRERDLQSPAPQAPESEFSPEERRVYAFAALRAALLIGLALLAGLGAVILLLLALWT